MGKLSCEVKNPHWTHPQHCIEWHAAMVYAFCSNTLKLCTPIHILCSAQVTQLVQQNPSNYCASRTHKLHFRQLKYLATCKELGSQNAFKPKS